MNNRSLIVAHRGLVTQHQENTLPAIQAAMDSRFCDGAEFDVFLTKDNRVVLFHDENLKRVTGEDLNIYDLTWADLKTIQILPQIEVDGGMRQYPGPAEIPLLENALEMIRGSDFFVDIELKAYRPSWGHRHVGGEVANIVKRMGMLEQLVCTSFNFFMLYDLEKEQRTVPSGFAYDDNMPVSLKRLNRLMEFNLIGRLVHSNAVCSEHTLIDEDTVRKYHQRDMKVGTFTLYPLTPGEMPEEKRAYYSEETKRLAALSVDWIETDQPELAWRDVHG